MGKLNAKGRSRESRHVRLYLHMLHSAAWLSLSGNAVKLLVYLASWEDGSNNGEIFMSERMAAEGIGVAKRTAGKLFDELELRGFIEPTAKGYFSVKRGPATRWRLTWLSWPAASKGPTNEWHNWKPDEQNSRAQLLHVTGAEIAPRSSAHRTTGAEIAPVEAEKAKSLGAIIAPHTVAIGSPILGTHFSDDFAPENTGGPIATAGEAA